MTAPRKCFADSREELARVWHDGNRTAIAKTLSCSFVLAQAVSPSRWFIGEGETAEAESAFTRNMDKYVLFFVFYLTMLLLFGFPWLRYNLTDGAIGHVGDFLAGFAGWRILDILTYRLYFIFVKSERIPWTDRTARRSLGFAIANMYEIIVAYAVLYLRFGYIYGHGAPLSRPSEAFYYSLVTLSTLGYGDYSPFDFASQRIVVYELATGLVFLAIVLPGLVSIFTAWTPKRVHTAARVECGHVQRAVEGYFEKLEAMELDQWAAMFEVSVTASPASTDQGPAGFPVLRSFFLKLAESCEGFDFSRDDVFVVGDSAAIKWTAKVRGKNGRGLTFEGVDIIEVNAAGRITSIRAYWHQEPILAEIHRFAQNP